MKILIDKEVLEQALEALQMRCGSFADERQWLIPELQAVIEQAAAEQEPTTFEYKVGDKVFVLNKPYMSAPENGVRYWAIDGLFRLARASVWCYGDKMDGDILNIFNCWKTKEDAEAFAAADLEHKKFLMGESR